MNQILMLISKHMHEALENRLPEVRLTDLEDEGAVFYMNGRNGTAFDWYVNEHFPCFFIYHADKEKLGAVKAILYTDGSLSVYVYGDKGHADPEEINYTIPADDGQLLNMAVLLTENADNKRIWDADIRKLACDGAPSDRSVETFLGLEKNYQPMIERRNMYGMTAIISKKIREGGYKVGYGIREEPTREGDSGWYFGVGDENDDYVNDASNLELWTIGSVLMYDQVLSEFITAPYGTAIVRADHDRFEIDEPGKEILIEKKQINRELCISFSNGEASMRGRLQERMFPLLRPARGKTRENGAFYGSRPAGNAGKAKVSEKRIDKSRFV